MRSSTRSNRLRCAEGSAPNLAVAVLVGGWVWIVGSPAQASWILDGPARGHTVATATEDLSFVRGDSNFSGEVDISDAIATLQALFVGGTPPLLCDDAADSNDDGAVDISDPIHTLTFLFVGGSQPPAPFPERGVDVTPNDDLRCAPRPQADRWVIAVRPLRCPAVGCDPWVGDPGGAVSAEEHLRRLSTWASAAGATVRASWAESTASSDDDHEDYELVAVVDGSSVAPPLLGAASRVILAPPGVIALSLWPSCGTNHWERGSEQGDVDRSHEELFADWIEDDASGTVYSVKREPIPGMEDDPCAAGQSRVGFRLITVVDDDRSNAALMRANAHTPQEPQVLFPASVKIVRRQPIKCDEPWAVLWRANHSDNPWSSNYSLMLAEWMAANDAPLYLAYNEVSWPQWGADCGDVEAMWLTAVVPESADFLLDFGFETVWP